MADEVVAPVVESPAQQISSEPKEITEQPDLLSRVAAFKKSQPTSSTDNSSDFFDYKEIENIKDPVAKEIALKAYKSMQSGLTKKTQTLAEERKSLESKLQEMNTWSPDRIQKELLNNPQFLQAAQQIAGTPPQNPPNSGLTNDEFSALTDKEKAELSAIKSQNTTLANEINALKQNNLQAIISQKDAQLQQKFPDYNPVDIDNSLRSLANMNPVDIREYIYKAVRFEESVKNAYEMGKLERTQLNNEKISAVSPSGISTVTSNGLPKKESNESGAAYFVRLAQARLAEARKK